MRIVKVPGVDGCRGCRNAGNKIIEELKRIKSNEKGKIVNSDLLDLEEIHVDNSNLTEQEKLIYENAGEEFEKRERLIFLGGDGSISFPIVKGFQKFCYNHEKIPCLIVFDAHADCGKSETGNRRWIGRLVERGFPRENILIVGARNLSQEEIEFLAGNKIKHVGMNQLSNDLQETMDIIMEFAYGKELYASFDIDVIDAAYVPGTERREVGGLTSRQAIYIISRIGLMKNLRGIDIVEIDLEKDRDNLTVRLAGKLVAELL